MSSDGLVPKLALGCLVALLLGGVAVVAVPFLGCFGLGLAIESGAIPPVEVVRGDALPVEVRRELRQAVLLPGEEVIFLQSDSLSDWLGEGCALTDQRVLTFWRGADGTVAHEAIALDEVAHLDTTWADWPEPTRVRVRSTGGGLLILELEPSEAGDERFVARLESLTGAGSAAPEPSPEPPAPPVRDLPPAEAPPTSRGPRGR